MEIPDDLLYTKEHEWVKVDADGEVLVGITDYAQEQLGDVVFVELPAADEENVVSRDEPFAVVESVKAASDVYAPVTGKVIEANDELVGTPSMLNEDCYGDGWMVRMESTVAEELSDLLTPEAYAELVEELTS